MWRIFFKAPTQLIDGPDGWSHDSFQWPAETEEEAMRAFQRAKMDFAVLRDACILSVEKLSDPVTF